VVLADGYQAGEGELVEHVRSSIAHYKAPKEIVFLDELPKTSTGKVQKFELREREATRQDATAKG
jgi:fatty-acyl-CoA synthase